MKIIIFILITFICLAIKAQIPYHGISPIGVNAPNPTFIFPQLQPETDQDGTIIMYNAYIGQNARITFEAGEEIVLHDRSTIVPSPSTIGYFYAHITSNQFQLYDMLGNWGAEKWKKFEIGVSLPISYDQMIENFLNGQTGSGTINPYDPDQFNIKATFYKPLGGTLTRYGFYYREIGTNGNSYTPSKSSQPFRVRLAPDQVGGWRFKFEFFAGLIKVGEYNGHFNCINSNLRGALSIGNYNHLIDANGNTFFAIGQDFGDLSDPINPIPNQCGSNILPPDGIAYRGFINDLANNGGNFIRIPTDMPNFQLEWEEPRVYGSNRMPNENYRRQYHAWELDKVFDVCENRGVYTMMLTENDQYFQNGGYICNTITGMEWPGHPYSQLTEYGVSSWKDIFTNVNVFNVYKKYLFYLSARYGYSPNICMWEVCNEISNLGHGLNNPFQTDQGTRNSVYSWAVNTANYLKSFEPLHLTTISSTDDHYQNPSRSDNPTNNPAFDIRSPHHYGHDRDVPFTRWNHTQTQLYGTSANPVTADVTLKPVLYGELGMTDDTEGDKCTEAEFHNGMWVTGISGTMGAGLYRYDNKNNAKRAHHFPALAAFFANMPFETNDFTSDYFSTSPVKVEAFYNVNNTGSKGFGWLHNYNYYWANDPNLIPNCINNTHNQTLGTASAQNLQFQLNGFQPGHKFDIELWYCYGSGGNSGNTFTKTATLFGGKLKFFQGLGGYPGSSQGDPDYAVKISKHTQAFRTAQPDNNPYFTDDRGSVVLENDTLWLEGNSTHVSGAYDPNNPYHHWNFGNGQSSDEQYPTVKYNQSGTYPTVYSTLNSLGDTVNYHQNVTVYVGSKTLEKKNVVTNADIMITPNPSTGIFNIQLIGVAKVFSFSIYDSKGALIIKSEGFTKSFDLSKFISGMYSIIFNTDQGTFVKKVIKQD